MNVITRPARGRRVRVSVAAVLMTIVAGLLVSTTTDARPAAAADHPRPTRFFVDPQGLARQHAADPGSVGAVARELSRVPQAIWLTDDHWTGARLRRDLADARRAHRVPVLVTYDIPGRDCGSYSAGGARRPTDYRAFVRRVTRAIGRHSVDLIVEPDALAGMATCLHASQRQQRERLLRYAVRTLGRDPHARVYLDAGHSGWVSTHAMAGLLRRSGVAHARGFSLNVSNFYRTATEQRYGNRLSRLLHGKHYVVDTSRNGRGPATDHEWCNPVGRALGHRPTTRTGSRRDDASLWIKPPGESDGSCAPGQPSAGGWFPSYAVMLARNAGWHV